MDDNQDQLVEIEQIAADGSEQDFTGAGNCFGTLGSASCPACFGTLGSFT